MINSNRVWITECPRDAMQGIHEFIPTDLKIEYLNALLRVGFDRLDFGSFVSHKAIPQLRDTAEVLDGLTTESTTELLAIIANFRGATDAASYNRISFLGFPFSVSETFQQRNTNSGIEQSFETVLKIQEVAVKNDKKLLIYISMAFGNPYGDVWDAEIVNKWITRLSAAGIKHIALADTVGLAGEKEEVILQRQ